MWLCQLVNTEFVHFKSLVQGQDPGHWSPCNRLELLVMELQLVVLTSSGLSSVCWVQLMSSCRWTCSELLHWRRPGEPSPTDLHVRTWQVNWELPAAAAVTVFQCRAAEPVPSPPCLLILESRCSGSRTIRQPQASFLSLASLELFYFSASASLSLSLPWAVHRIILSLHLVFNFLLSSALWCSRCSLRQHQFHVYQLQWWSCLVCEPDSTTGDEKFVFSTRAQFVRIRAEADVQTETTYSSSFSLLYVQREWYFPSVYTDPLVPVGTHTHCKTFLLHVSYIQMMRKLCFFTFLTSSHWPSVFTPHAPYAPSSPHLLTGGF